MEYEAWNNLLAKRFQVMHKNYRKFSQKFLGYDPLEVQVQVQANAIISDIPILGNNLEEEKEEAKVNL